jgi:hypothetical protein
LTDALFPGEPRELPERTGPTWTVRLDDPPQPPPVRHAIGYGAFVELAGRFGTDARSLFDLRAFAHFVRAHRAALEADPALERSAVVFLGDVCVANHPECFWTNRTNGLAVESEHLRAIDDEPGWEEVPAYRALHVEATVPAILAADERRFLEFRSVVDGWR